MTPLVFIIILNFNGKDDTLECLKSVERLQSSGFSSQTVVVDNGSKEKLKVSGEKFVVIQNEKNLGYAGGNNVGIKYSLKHGADYALILNNDTIVDKDLIAKLIEIAQSDKSIGIVAPKIYFAKGFEFHKDRYTKEELGKVFWYAGGIMDWNNVVGHHRGVDEVDKGQYDQAQETDFASGCCMLVSRTVFENVGLFDEKYYLYYEDSDLSERVKRQGFKIIYHPKSIIWHKNAGSTGGSGSNLQDYYITRNRLLFGMRYAPLRAKVALLRESLRILAKGRPWQKRGVEDFYRRKFGKGSYSV